MSEAPEGTRAVRRLGVGTYFDVWLVETREGLFACKRLRSRFRGEPEAVRALAREAKALSLLAHPSLPTLVGVGSDSHGPFVLETVVEGLAWSSVRARWLARGGLPASLFSHLAREAARTLAELHAARHAGGCFMHGDLSPDNLWMGPEGAVRVLDFGLSRWGEAEPADAPPAPHSRGALGTLPFVAPEVARGEALPSQRADTYALAASLLSLASAAPLCPGEGAALLARVASRGLTAPACPYAPGSAAAQAFAACARAVAFAPEERLVEAAALTNALD